MIVSKILIASLSVAMISSGKIWGDGEMIFWGAICSDLETCEEKCEASFTTYIGDLKEKELKVDGERLKSRNPFMGINDMLKTPDKAFIDQTCTKRGKEFKEQGDDVKKIKTDRTNFYHACAKINQQAQEKFWIGRYLKNHPHHVSIKSLYQNFPKCSDSSDKEWFLTAKTPPTKTSAVQHKQVTSEQSVSRAVAGQHEPLDLESNNIQELCDVEVDLGQNYPKIRDYKESCKEFLTNECGDNRGTHNCKALKNAHIALKQNPNCSKKNSFVKGLLILMKMSGFQFERDDQKKSFHDGWSFFGFIKANINDALKKLNQKCS